MSCLQRNPIFVNKIAKSKKIGYISELIRDLLYLNLKINVISPSNEVMDPNEGGIWMKRMANKSHYLMNKRIIKCCSLLLVMLTLLSSINIIIQKENFILKEDLKQYVQKQLNSISLHMGE